MECNNEGASRLVWLTKSYAIKLPRCFIRPSNDFYGDLISFLDGWACNRREYKWSKWVQSDSDNDFKFLCKVKYSFLFSIIIIMEKATPLTEEEFSNIDYSSFSFGFEHKLDSYGKIKNEIVVVDYG